MSDERCAATIEGQLTVVESIEGQLSVTETMEGLLTVPPTADRIRLIGGKTLTPEETEQILSAEGMSVEALDAIVSAVVSDGVQILSIW